MSVHNPQDCDPKSEATKILNLTRPEYNKCIGLYAHRKWIEGKRKKCPKYDKALQEMSDNTLKVFNGELFRANFIKHRKAFSILGGLYSTRQFGKRRFLQQQRKQKFDDTFINKTVKIFNDAAGCKDYIVAYGDGTFPLAMKGMDGGSSAHGRLMVLLSKRVRIVMTNEYRTTKACPKCKNKELIMQCPKGNAKYYISRQGRYYRKVIHGLSQCKNCNTLFSRDYIASLNICRSFRHYFERGCAPNYLKRNSDSEGA